MISVRLMTAADIPLGLRLCRQAGWNQTEADWQRFLDLEPDGCFVGEFDGRPVATATTRVFDSIAWIGMLLVDPSLRRRGVGTAMMEHATKHLAGRGVATTRLDATPLGRPIYERLGFVYEYDLARWEGVAPGGPTDPCVRPVAARELEAIVDLDRRVTGTNRDRLLRYLFDRDPQAMLALIDDGELAGYAAWRPGVRAVQIGPIIAGAETAGRVLGDAALARCAGRSVFVDVPEDNAAASDWARSRGLSVQRRLARMFRGEPVRETHQALWASSGPENG